MTIHKQAAYVYDEPEPIMRNNNPSTSILVQLVDYFLDYFNQLHILSLCTVFFQPTIRSQSVDSLSRRITRRNISVTPLERFNVDSQFINAHPIILQI